MKVIATANSMAVSANPFDLAVVGGPAGPGALTVISVPRGSESLESARSIDRRNHAALRGTVMMTRGTDSARANSNVGRVGGLSTDQQHYGSLSGVRGFSTLRWQLTGTVGVLGILRS